MISDVYIVIYPVVRLIRSIVSGFVAGCDDDDEDDMPWQDAALQAPAVLRPKESRAGGVSETHKVGGDWCASIHMHAP